MGGSDFQRGGPESIRESDAQACSTKRRSYNHADGLVLEYRGRRKPWKLQRSVDGCAPGTDPMSVIRGISSPNLNKQKHCQADRPNDPLNRFTPHDGSSPIQHLPYAGIQNGSPEGMNSIGTSFLSVRASGHTRSCQILRGQDTVGKAVGTLTLPRNSDVSLYPLDQLLTIDHRCHRVPSAAASAARFESTAAPKCRSKNLMITFNASFDSGTSAL